MVRTKDHEHTCHTKSYLSNKRDHGPPDDPYGTYRSNTAPQIDSQGFCTALR